MNSAQSPPWFESVAKLSLGAPGDTARAQLKMGCLTNCKPTPQRLPHTTSRREATLSEHKSNMDYAFRMECLPKPLTPAARSP